MRLEIFLFVVSIVWALFVGALAADSYTRYSCRVHGKFVSGGTQYVCAVTTQTN